MANLTSDSVETVSIVSSGVLGSSSATTDDNVVTSLAGLSTSNVNKVNISGASDLTLDASDITLI